MTNVGPPNVDTKLAKGNGENGYIIPAVIPSTDTADHTKSAAYTGTAANNTGDLLGGAGVGLTVFATTDCFVVFGSAATITAATTSNGEFIPGGQKIQLPYGAVQTFSAIRSASDGTIYVTEIVT